MNTLFSTDIQTSIATTIPQWKRATWEEYLVERDASTTDRGKLFFYNGYLLVDNMGWEGVSHANIGDLFTMLFFVWFSQIPEQILNSFGGCLLEKPTAKKAAAPDLVLYLGEDYPRWRQGEPRLIDLDRWRVPNLVGEISDTTLASDLDRKKHLYAELGIPEYWVIDIQGKRVFAFQLQSDGSYEECSTSSVLAGLQISLLEQTLARLKEGTNTSAAVWFSQQIAGIS